MARFYGFKSNKFALFIGSNCLYTSPFSFLSCPTPVRLTASLNVWSFRPSFPADCDSCWAWRGEGRLSLSKSLYGALKRFGWSFVISHYLCRYLGSLPILLLQFFIFSYSFFAFWESICRLLSCRHQHVPSLVCPVFRVGSGFTLQVSCRHLLRHDCNKTRNLLQGQFCTWVLPWLPC